MLLFVVEHGNFYCSGTDIDSKTIALIHTSGEFSPYLLFNRKKRAVRKKQAASRNAGINMPNRSAIQFSAGIGT